MSKYRLVRPTLARLGTWRMKGRFTQPPIIIGGCGRSGTSLLLAMLSAHPHVFAISRETGAFSGFERRRVVGVEVLVPTRWDRIGRYMLTHRIPRTVTRWCEKSPSNVRLIAEILECFQESVRFVHIVRDGRDVLTSRHPDKPGEYWVSPGRWVREVREGLAFRDHPCVHTVKYEDLVSRYQEVMQGICDFLHEEFVPELRAWHNHATVRRHRAWPRSVGKLHSASSGRWRRSEYRERVEEVLRHEGVADLLAELGYTD